MTYVNPQNTKSRPDGKYGEVINQIAKDGVCPFCPEHLKKYHAHPLDERKFWWVTDNMYPYKPNLHHRLLIHKKHITHVREISPEAWTELDEIIISETNKRVMDGGTLIMRFGLTKFTGASVSHLHAQLLQSNPDDPTYDPAKGITMRIG